MSNFLKSLKVKGIEIDPAGAVTGNVLKYDGTKFGAASAGGSSVGALDDLSDVVITTPYSYQTLSYNGTNWVNDDASTITYVSNAEATTLNVGEVVYLYQQQGDRASVKRAINTSDATSAKTLGVVAASIAANASGPVVTQGYVTGCNLGSFTAGQTVYLSASAGGITSTKPYAPNHLVYIGVVVRANNGNGILYVRAQNGYELDEIHDVDLTTTPPTAGQYLRFGGTVWTADTIDLGTDTTGNYMSGISGTSPVSVTHTPAEGSSATVALASGYGDTQNPYASKTANYFLASPNGSASTPSFRAIVAADIPTLNQNTTGTASNITASSNTTLTSLTNLTTVGTLTGLTVDGPSSTSMTIGDWSTTPAHSGIEGNMGYLLLGKNALDNYNIYLRSNNSVGGVYIGANNTNILNVNVNGINVTGAATVTGNVGIGTTTPSTALQVIGTATLATVKAGSGTVAISSASYVSLYGATNYNTSTPHGFATGDTVAVTGITPSSFNRTATINVVNSTQFFFSLFNGSTGGAYSSGGTVTGPPSTLYVDATNDRIGIGTSSPGTKLDVLGTATVRAAATQDGIALTGRAGGTGSYEVTLTPTTLSADQTLTLPNASGTVALIAVSDTAPSSPVAGNLWYKSSTGIMYVYYDSFWVEVGSPSSGLDGGSA